MLIQWDLSSTNQLWIRVLFVEGQLYIWEAQTFLDTHIGMEDRSLRMPAQYFQGPVVATMLFIGPKPTAYQTKHISLFLNSRSNLRYLSAYQWAVARHHLTTIFDNSKINLYLLKRPWWDESSDSMSPGEPTTGTPGNNVDT